MEKPIYRPAKYFYNVLVRRNKLPVFLLVLIIFCLLAGCGRQPDIYVCGSYTDNEKSQACYWFNGERVSLSDDGIHDSDTGAICVDGDDVYVAGKWNNGKRYTACYWKGMQKVDLPDVAGGNSHASGITVKNKTVYVSGHFSVKKRNFPCYWADKKRIALKTKDNKSGSANAVFVTDKGDVYAAGGYNIDGGYFRACMWGPAGRIDLPFDVPENAAMNGRRHSDAYDIKVVDAKVYAAGYVEYMQKDGGAVFQPCLWVDGKQVNLESEGLATSIAVSGNDIYAAGYMTGEMKNRPCFWKNGKLNVMEGKKQADSHIMDCVLYRGVMYSAGDSEYMPYYWSSTSQHALSSGLKYGYAAGIAVK